MSTNNDRGRFPGRAGYRNDNFRGTGNFSGGNFSGGCGYGRNEFERRGDFSNQTHGNAGRNEETVHRVYQNGGGKATQSRQHELGCDCTFCSSFVENSIFVF